MTRYAVSYQVNYVVEINLPPDVDVRHAMDDFIEDRYTHDPDVDCESWSINDVVEMKGMRVDNPTT